METTENKNRNTQNPGYATAVQWDKADLSGEEISEDSRPFKFANYGSHLGAYKEIHR